jgi:hypothetical protein
MKVKVSHVRCSGSMAFPTNYNGEFTRCRECGRKMKLHVNGRVPNHNRPDCGLFNHDWDSGDSTCGTGCDTYSVMYTCLKCGKTKVKGGA